MVSADWGDHGDQGARTEKDLRLQRPGGLGRLQKAWGPGIYRGREERSGKLEGGGGERDSIGICRGRRKSGRQAREGTSYMCILITQKYT